MAAAPVPLGALADAMTARFPSAPPEAIRELLDGLAAEGFLSTSTQPPLTATDPLLRTLLHEHHMRALGLDPALERQTGRLARAAALRCLALAGRL